MENPTFQIFMAMNNHGRREATTMQVTYNGFTGELVKLEKEPGMLGMTDDGKMYAHVSYTLSIYDSEKNVTHSFTGVKFMGGEVSFSG